MAWAYESVDSSISLDRFVALWNQRGKLLSGALRERQSGMGIVAAQRDFGVRADGVSDDTVRLQAAINSLPTTGSAFGGDVRLPVGIIKTTAPITVPRNVRLIGANATIAAPGTTYNGECIIYGAHTGAAVVDLLGTHCASLVDLKVYGDQSSTPKTGIRCGRNSPGSAGFHVMRNVSVEGYFSKAPVYSIASEENYWDHLHISLLGGGALYPFYTSQGDDLAVGGMTGSSNIHGTFNHPWIRSDVNDATSALIYMNCGGSTWGWTFNNSYLIPKSGAYVTINSGQVDASDTIGPINFFGISGEITAGGLNPISGFNLTSPGAYKLRNLNAIGVKFALDAAGFFVRQGANLSIYDSIIRPSEALGVGSSLVTSQIFNSIIGSGNSTALQIYGDLKTLNGKVTHADATALIHTSVALNNGAGAGAGTIANAPAAGNPTKWVPIDDNGTVRYVPAW